MMPSCLAPDTVDRIFAEITRREFGLGLASLTAVGLLGGCSDDDGTPTATPSPSAWEWIDDRGERVARAGKPERIVVYEALLPALWDLGLRPVAVLASMSLADNPDIAPVAERLGIDLASVTALSTTYGEVNLEAMAAANPELIVTYVNTRSPVLYGYADEPMQEKAAQLAPTAVLDIHNSVPTELARVLDLARALGVDVDAPEVRAARERFETATERLRSLAEDKQGMSVLAAVPLPDGVFVAAPSTYPFARYLQTLGFDVLVPEDDAATVSWELVPTELAADAVLLAAGPDYPTHETLQADQPTWSSHPAAEAGQVASAFPNVTIPSYGAMADLLEKVATALEAFEPLE